MWSTISHITTGIGLVAFIGALGLVAYRATMKHRLNTLRAVPAQQRASIVTQQLNTYGIKAENLSQPQQYRLAERELNIRARNSLLLAFVAIVVLIISGIIVIFGSNLLATTRVQTAASTNTAAGISLLGECTMSPMPVSIPAHDALHLLLINPMRFKATSWGLFDVRNDADELTKWPPKEKLDMALEAHSPPFMYQCDVTNQGKDDLVNVALPMRFWFGSEGGEANAKNFNVMLSPLNGGKRLHFSPSMIVISRSMA